ncbi:hypothetical protein DRQ29_00370 [bacterium]|nr:MAG: hypothetical protein DRQ29_00370 [bacterium]
MSKMIGKKEVKKVSELIDTGSDFTKPLMSELEGKEITITDIRIGEGKYGEYAIVKLENGEEYRTSGTVLIKQLKELQKHIQNYKVVAKVKKVKNYYMLE